jgi:hypothetical protein
MEFLKLSNHHIVNKKYIISASVDIDLGLSFITLSNFGKTSSTFTYTRGTQEYESIKKFIEETL